jgi:hypothetical protein
MQSQPHPYIYFRRDIPDHSDVDRDSIVGGGGDIYGPEPLSVREDQDEEEEFLEES